MRLLLTTGLIGLLGCSDKSLVIQNPTPIADIISHEDGSEVLEGFQVNLVGSVTDSNHSPEELLVTWYVGLDVVCETTTPEADGSTACEVVLAPNETEITLEVKDAENARGSDTIELVVVETEQPVAEILSPVLDGVYYSDQLITFEGVVSDAEDDASDLVAFWESNLDGILTDVDTEPNESGEILGYGTLTEGQHAIELEVEDTTGKTSRESVIIDVGPPNSDPNCEILAPINGSAGTEGDLISFMGMASDVDVPSDWLSVTWTSDKDGEIGTSTPFSSGDISFSYANLSVDTHSITMMVIDEIGASCTTGITYTVGTPPSINIDSPVNNEIYSEGEFLDFIATISDAQDQPNEISLDWSLNGTSVSSQGATSSGTAQYSDNVLAYGSYTLLVTATDTDGLTDSAQTSFTINALPTAPIISISPDPAYTTAGLAANIDTPSTDSEGSTVSYSYEWQLNNVVQASYITTTLPSSATNKGEEWRVRVTPNDGIANGSVGEAVIIIQNTAPLLSGLSITPTGTTYNDDVLTCSVTVTDPDETLTPVYEWSLDGNVVGSSAILDLALVGAMPDDVLTCMASVVDGDGETASDSIMRTVSNRAPVIGAMQIMPNTGVITSSELTCSVTATDADGETLNPTYSWTIGGNSYAGSTLQLDPSMVSPNSVVVCNASVSDDVGDSDSDSANVTVENTLPTITASISANGTTNTGELTCLATASDLDDSPAIPAIVYEWFNSAGSLGGSNPLQLDSTMGVDGETIDCTATATDLTGDIVTTTVSHAITNSPPEIDNISLSPSIIDVNSTSVTCNTTTSDADGDSVTEVFEWFVDGQLQSETTNMFTAPFIAGTLLACRVTPNDGKIDGDFAEDTAIIQNTAPVVDSVTLTPSSLYTNDTITATAILSDADASQSGSLTAIYEWYVDGGMVQNGTDNTLNGVSYFDRDETVYVVVTPNDGVEDGLTMQSSDLVISNTAPTAPSISIIADNDPAEAGIDDLTCSVDVESTDIDGDVVTYDYTWYNELGLVAQTTSATTSLMDVYLGSGTNVGTWRCEVFANDGTDASAVVDLTYDVVDGCPIEGDGSNEFCSSIDCSKILADGYSTGDGFYWIDPQEDGTAYEVSCLMDANYDGGGWTLISVHSDDGQDTWTWNNRHYFDTDITTFGSLSALNEDFKSQALHDVGMQDILFVHAPSGVWAGYNDADSGSGDFGTFMLDYQTPSSELPNTGLIQTSGTLSAINFLNETKLYFSVIDGDENSNNSHGPTWNASTNNNVPFDDPGNNALGPISNRPNVEMNRFFSDPSYNSSTGIYVFGLGFGNATVLNTGGYGLAENHMQVLVRRDYNDTDEDGLAAWEDCDDNNSSVTTNGSGSSEDCAALSCLEILNNGASQGDDTYWIDPDGLGAFEAYCDMTTDGGGWTLVAALTNRYAREDAPAHFFTQDFLQESTNWQINTQQEAVTPNRYGILKVDDWNIPTKIRYQMRDTSTGDIVNKVTFEDSASIDHLQQYTTERHLRTGSASGYATAFSTIRTYYYASDYTDVWSYDTSFGRFKNSYTQGWQFGLSVNLPDNQIGYDGIHDDKDRTEYNLGVAGYLPHMGDISGYWPSYCTSSCSNEDWAINMPAGLAVVEVWHQ